MVEDGCMEIQHDEKNKPHSCNWDTNWRRLDFSQSPNTMNLSTNTGLLFFEVETFVALINKLLTHMSFFFN